MQERKVDWSEDLIPLDQAGTLDGLFFQRVRRTPDAIAYRNYDRTQKQWYELSWDDMARHVARWRQALSGEDLEPGDRVAVLLRNSPEWVMFDQAALSLGLVVVPLYTDDRADAIAYILKDAAVKLLLVQDTGRWNRMADAVEELPDLQRVVVLETARQPDPGEDDLVREASNWLPPRGEALQKRKADPHTLASIVYTSGTTGRPKGVMLSHYNMLSIAHASVTVVDCYQQDSFLSFLPLSHTLERTGGYYLPMMAGASVSFARSIPQLAEDLQTIQPTAIIAVPRIFERVYARVQDQLKHKPAFARMLFQMALSVGFKEFEYRMGRQRWFPGLLLYPLLRHLVSAKILDKLGGRLRVAVSGGAAISPEIAKVFLGLGLPMLQGYGLTETSPVISVNPMDNIKPESVGVPLRGVTTKIGEDDELLVKTPGMMLGYWNNHAATAAMIDPQGWLHTGDQARIDEDGHIHITGRIKDILVLSNGEKIPPSDMEMAIALDPVVEQAMVVGEGKPYLGALVVLNPDLWGGLAEEFDLDSSNQESLNDEKIQGVFLKRIRGALKDFPGYAKIRRVAVLLEPWSIENGLMTPTMKIKRQKVTEHHRDLIETLYKGGPV
ncbi:MAG: long-chain fatty acid--CoA ligase [Candidatus Thiodiazotropha lotti]|uniref:Long-chain fatty acid--CoA ligase n=1 Tax=Candidatus Thiodiazotropha lotti TaxID=2792787 RepID=A0A9E4N0Y5_9GAMM|nr:long-chain fatty acid--CoA ligase [Candidatus Thiodiazotropha lotti]ODC00092.1 AMP-dependent synthetase [Candidatus Thiodiazotropha endoloripes]MCG7922269.1 long-chain fatty acid--CoA ligase [Candidatus Thiodiazotropha lotti]MCG7939079.1 long-chain fatty acid--CoA ligase [Candidatus Thiodiazotropha lotti]MCG7987033.1 long-chain fatty acid--CoA ligase [Candidatus Thiodiazotropha lotti]